MATATSTAPAPKSVNARNVPYIPLDDAVEKAKILYQKARTTPIKCHTAATYLGFSPKSSSGNLVLAALKKYGLLQFEGNSEGRQVRLSELGCQIVRDQRDSSPDRDARIRQAALTPKVHRELWDQWRDSLPDDKTLLTYLTMDKEYSEEAANLLVRVYRRTYAFARLAEQGTMEDDADDVDGGGSSAAELDGSHGRRAGDHPMETQRVTRPEQTTSPANGDAGPVRQMSFPLVGVRSFDVRFPVDLTKEEFDIALQAMKVFERTMVAKTQA
jgi:hypothetical protein